MNKKILRYVLFGLVLAAGLLWLGNTTYRSLWNLASLDVRNAPLSKVVNSLASQTGENIVIDRRLEESLVTLDIDNLPLRKILELIGQQTGSEAKTFHAVHKSRQALDRLADAIQEGSEWDETDWKKLSAQYLPRTESLNSSKNSLRNDSDETPKSLTGPSAQSGSIAQIKLDQDDLQDGDLDQAIREKLRKAGVDDSEKLGKFELPPPATGTEESPTIKKVVFKRRGLRFSEVQEYGTDYLMLESRLQPRLEPEKDYSATTETARELARQLDAEHSTVYALLPVSHQNRISTLELSTIVESTITSLTSEDPRGVNFYQTAAEHIGTQFSDTLQKEKDREMMKLTPEQKVQRLRNTILVRSNTILNR